jgi:hypothetical protein
MSPGCPRRLQIAGVLRAADIRYLWTSRRGHRGLVGKPSDFGAQSQVTIIYPMLLTRDGVDNC